MKNYAIVLGVAQYDHLNPLPSCKRDADFIYNFLRITGKYEMLQIPGDTLKKDALKMIANFLPSTPGKAEEILFYYSGHGHQAQDMYFSLKNTSSMNLSKTCLTNSEIDNLIRKAGPKLFVKLIDSCHSGLSYIKGIHDPLETPIAKGTGFENCIFMSSSKRNEYSYANSLYGFFTKAIIDCVKSSRSSTVRYTDLQQFLAATFQNNDLQTPYFMTQCDGTEVFCEKTGAVEMFLTTYNFTKPGPAPRKPQKPQPHTQPSSGLSSYLALCRREASASPYSLEQRRAKSDALRNEAGDRFSEGKLYESVLLLMQALKYDPECITTWAVLGRSYRNLSQYDKAREAYTVALSICPGDPLLMMNLGSLELALGNGQAAYENYKYVSYQLYQLSPLDQPVAIANFAIAAAMTGQRQEANALLTRAQSMGYSNMDALKQRVRQLLN